MQLFVDGNRVGRDQNYTTPKTYVGYWRIGADQTTGFTNKPTDAGLAGSIDDVAVYPKALSKADIQAHYLASGRVGGLAGGADRRLRLGGLGQPARSVLAAQRVVRFGAGLGQRRHDRQRDRQASPATRPAT